MCSAQAENRLELSDSLLLGHYCWGLHPGAPTPSQCASISPCEPQFKRAQSALKVCMGSGCACPDWVDARDLLQRRSVTLTSAYYPDRLVPTLAGCALQSPRYGLLYCHFLEGRKEGRKKGRKEGRMTCVCQSSPIYFNLFWYPSAHAHPVSPSTHAIPIHARCVLESSRQKVHCNGCLHLPTLILLPWQFFSAQ